MYVCKTYVRRIKHAYDSFAVLQQKGVIGRNSCGIPLSVTGVPLLQGRACGREAGRMDKIIGDFFTFPVSCPYSYLYLDVVLGASGRRPTHTHTPHRISRRHDRCSFRRDVSGHLPQTAPISMPQNGLASEHSSPPSFSTIIQFTYTTTPHMNEPW